MALQPGLFYAYAKNIKDDHTYRYLITFSSRKIADEWWRAISDSVASGYRRFANVDRVSMQWYTHDPSGHGNIFETVNDDRCALKFRGQVMFTLLMDRGGRNLSIAPVLNYVDHKSGQRFFIRSVLIPNLFWFYSPDDQKIRASSRQRTAFFIDIVETDEENGGRVMIGSDKVSIAAHRGKYLAVGKSGAEFFNFSDFDGKFKRGVVDSEGELVVHGQFGERWELVF